MLRCNPRIQYDMKWLVIILLALLASCRSQHAEKVQLRQDVASDYRANCVSHENLELRSFIDSLRSSSIEAEGVSLRFESTADDVAVCIEADRLRRQSATSVRNISFWVYNDSAAVQVADSSATSENAIAVEQSKPPAGRSVTSLFLCVLLMFLFITLMVMRRRS